jgi:membrane protein implicated in regulation of membrane protease activity
MDVTHIAYWHWWIAAALLAILEMVMPGTMLIFFAAAAGVVGLIALVMPGLGWQAQFLAFGVLSVAGIFAWRKYRATHPGELDGGDQPMLNKRAAQYVGRTVTLIEPIVNGSGKAKVDDTIWRVIGPDLPNGEVVKVTKAEGGFLTVERL